MTDLEKILADLSAAEQKCLEARIAIQNGDHAKAVHSMRRVEYSAAIATQTLRTFSDQAFPAATEHLRNRAVPSPTAGAARIEGQGEGVLQNQEAA
jgi:hypothetical protein